MKAIKGLGITIALAALSLACTSAFCYAIAWCFDMRILFKQVFGVWICILWAKVLVKGIADYARKSDDR